MASEFRLPDLGEGVKEGLVLRVLVSEGERVEEDQLLIEVETDKAAVEIPSPTRGVVSRIHAKAGQVVNVGDILFSFEEAGARTTGAGDRGAIEHAPPRERVAASSGADSSSRSAARTHSTLVVRRKPASPAVRKLARTLGVELESIDGSGPAGRIVRADIERAARAEMGSGLISTDEMGEMGSGLISTPIQRGSERTRKEMSPDPISARKEMSPDPISADPISATRPSGREERDAWGSLIREAVSPTRRRIAEIMSRAVATIPHVTDSDDADVTELERLRRDHNESSLPAHRVSSLAFVVRAVVRALQMHPVFNASLDETSGEILYKRYYNVAIGVQTERGLVAPVLRHADRLSIAQLGEEIGKLGERAKAGKLSLDETAGATYTISNAGAMGGSRYSTPIITLPQVAVLAVGRTRLMPWVVDGAIVPRSILPLSHSIDHRLIDGAQEIAFMRQVIGDLEHPGRLVL